MRDVREVLAEAARVGDPGRVAELTPGQALDAVELLGGMLAVARVAAVEPVRGSGASPARVEAGVGQEAADRLLTAAEVAELLRCTREQVYRQAKRWPFAQELGHRTLRVPEKALRAWLARQSRR